MGEANPKQSDEVDETFVDELKAGTELMHGQYTIESFLNAGGFGITYNARDSLDRRVVIKECFPGAFCRRSRYMVTARSRAHQNELQSIVRLFVQEAKSLSKLDHPNIVGVHNVFEENSTAYMALDFVEGRDLLDIIEDDDATLTPEQVTNILREILGAIAFIHDQGILHRDISPDNILVDNNNHPVLIDFGAAREQATKQSRVLSALRVVKDGYSPQEFYIQGSEQGPYSDLYALGASFYHVIAGDVPPNSQARLAAIASSQPDPYEPLKGSVPGLDDGFLEAIDRSLAVLPKDRLQSASDWIGMIDGTYDPIAATVANTVRESRAGMARAATSQPYVPIAAPAVSSDPADAEVKKSKVGALLASTAVLAIVAGAVVFTQLGGEEVADGDIAPVAAVEAQPETVELVPEVSIEEPAPVETAVVTDPVVEPPENVEVVEILPEPADTNIFEAAAALASTEGDAEGSPVAEAISGRLVSGEPTPINAPVGAVPEILAGPFDVDLTTLFASARPNTGPVVRPEGLVLQALVVGSDYSVGGQVASSNSEPGFSEVLPVAVVTPSMPVDGTAPTELAGADLGVSFPEMDSVPILPVLFQSLSGLPNSELPVFPFAPEVVEVAAQVSTDEAPQEVVDVVPEAAEFIQLVSAAQLPFDGLFSAEANETRIYTVNGVAVDNLDEFNEVVGSVADLGSSSQVEVTVETGLAGEGIQQVQTLTLPVVQEMRLLDGTVFESIQTEDGWKTTVAVIPRGSTTDLLVGDVVLAYVNTTELLTERTSIADIIKRESAAGTSDFSFAVSRGGATWVASLSYQDPTAPSQD